MKYCTKCKIEKEVSLFRVAKGYKDNICSWCKECEKLWHKENKPKPRLVTVEHQICVLCKKNLDSDKFSKCKTRSNGLDNRCKECYKELTRTRRGGLDPKTIERRKLEKEGKFRCGLCGTVKELKEKTEDGCCYRCERNRGNKSARKRYTTEKRREQSKKYAFRERIDRHKRRAILANAKGECTKKQLKDRYDYYGNCCIYCKSGDRITTDHLIPLSRGGTNFPSNLAPACYSCNCSKNKKTYKEFMEYRRLNEGVCPIK